ncbi:MAG: hypothetical protein WAW10_00420 [Gallionella sp.]
MSVSTVGLPKWGAEFLKEPGVGEQFILKHTIHRLKLDVKVIVKEHVPRHGWIMYLKTYYFKVVMHKNPGQAFMALG